MSFLKSKHSGWLSDGTRTPFTGGGGGGGTPAPTQTTAYNTNIPEYARPYVENMLQSTQTQIYNDDMTGFRPYQPYSSDVNNYFAEFSPLQQSAQQAAYNMQVPGQFGLGSELAGLAGIGALGAQGNAALLGNEALGYGGMGADIGQQGQQLGVSGGGAYGQMGAGFGAAGVGLGQQASSLAPQATRFGQRGAGFGAAGASLAPSAQNYGQTASNIGMGGLGYGNAGFGFGQRGVEASEQGFGAGQRFEGMATDPRAQQAYMSPYMQNVVDFQKQGAVRDFDIAQQVRNAQAVDRGAFGGSRAAVVDAEAQRGLMSQLQGIQATGTQKAFEDAQRQMQFGSQLGLQGLQAGYQGLQAGMQGADTGIRGLGTAIQGQQTGLQGLGQAGQLYGLGIQGAQAGLQGLQGAQEAYRTGLQGTAQGIQGAQTGLAGVDRQLAGTAQGLQGAQTGLQGVQGATAAGQYGLAGLGQATQAASTLGQLGASQLGAEQSIANLQNQFGREQQAQEQSKINQAIQDYAIQQQYPMMQLGLMSNMLRGLPMQAQTTQLYQAQPSALQQGAGLIGAGASLFGGRAEGGAIKMAEGGITGYKYGGIAEPKLAGMADNLSVPQLVERLKDPALTKGERDVFQEALAVKQNTAARNSGIAAAGGGLFNTMGYAGGGILAFAEGDVVEDKERSAFQQDLIDTFGYSGAKGARPEVPEYMKKIGSYFTKPREKTTLTPAQLDAIAAKQGVFAEGSPALSEGIPTPAPTAAPAGPSTGSQASKAPSSQAAETSGLSSILAGLRKEGPQGELGTDYLDKLKALEAGADKRLSKADRLAMAKGFLKFGATPAPGGIGQAAVAGLSEYAEGYGKAIESDEKFRMENAKLQSDIKNLQRAEERGDVKLAAELQEKIADRANRLQTANISAAASGRARAGDDAYVKQLVAQGMSLEQALQAVKGAGKAESNDIARMKAADAALAANVGYMRFANSKKPEDQQKAAQIRQDVYTQYGISAGGISGQQTAGGVPKDIQGILNKYQ